VLGADAEQLIVQTEGAEIVTVPVFWHCVLPTDAVNVQV